MVKQRLNLPDVTAPVFKSRLDKFKTNTRNGKYFESREVIYRLVWAEPKTITTSAILHLIKSESYHFTMKSPCFYDTNRKLLKRAF